jgi:hypothetical protein
MPLPSQWPPWIFEAKAARVVGRATPGCILCQQASLTWNFDACPPWGGQREDHNAQGRLQNFGRVPSVTLASNITPTHPGVVDMGVTMQCRNTSRHPQMTPTVSVYRTTHLWHDNSETRKIRGVPKKDFAMQRTCRKLTNRCHSRSDREGDQQGLGHALCHVALLRLQNLEVVQQVTRYAKIVWYLAVFPRRLV